MNGDDKKSSSTNKVMTGGLVWKDVGHTIQDRVSDSNTVQSCFVVGVRNYTT